MVERVRDSERRRAADSATDPERVRQPIDDRRSGVFFKEIHRVDGPGGPVVLVRKRLADGHGAAPPVVLLVHGYAQNRYSWHVSRRSFVNHLAAAGFDVFNVELRGVGRSRLLGGAPARGLACHVAEDLPAAVARVQALTGERRLFLAGHSVGAFVAAAFAGRSPAAVRGVVSLAGVHDFARRNRLLRLAGRALLLLSQDDGAAPARVPTHLAGRALFLARAAFDAPPAAFLPLQAWAPGSMAPAVLAEAVRRSFEPASRGVTRDLARLACGERLVDGAGVPLLAPFEAQRHVPLLVVAGREDVLVSPADARAAFERSAARDRTFFCPRRAAGEPGWGHMDLLLGDRAPERVWRVVSDWLAARANGS